jgi:bisphosphoglycerate-independent phosphoglycerate mutase (AlkP superfamily)
VFFFNYRSDRMREIVSVFGIDGEPTKKDKKETKPWLEDLVRWFSILRCRIP